MSVQLNQDFYEPGQLMIGMIYLQVNTPFKCGYVQLDVESEEKAEFTRYYYKTEHYTDGEGNRRSRQV